jgi:putative Mg2+ transporter-C (MgtC) family protein
VPSQDVIKDFLREHGFRLEGVSYRIANDGTTFEYRMTIRTSDANNLTRLAEYLSVAKDVRHFEIAPAGE